MTDKPEVIPTDEDLQKALAVWNLFPPVVDKASAIKHIALALAEERTKAEARDHKERIRLGNQIAIERKATNKLQVRIAKLEAERDRLKNGLRELQDDFEGLKLAMETAS